MAKHIKASSSFFCLTRKSQIIPPILHIDPIYYRHHGYREYVARLMTWSGDNAALGVSGSGRSEPGSTVVTDMMARVILTVDFRYLLRRKVPSVSINGGKDNYFYQAHYKRMIRYKFGYLLPHERREIWRVNDDRQSHLYVVPPPEWANLELPEGFFAPLSSILA